MSNLRRRTSSSFRYQFSPSGGLIFLVLLAVGFAFPCFAARKERLITSWKPTHYNVSLVFNENLTEITSATTEISIVSLKDSLTNVDFDFGEMPIDSVNVNNHAARYKHSAGTLNVELRETLSKGKTCLVTITYHGKPRNGLILTLEKSGKHLAVGDNWPDRVHHWIPTLDHPSAKASVTFSITAPAGNSVVANGFLTDVQNNSRTTQTWTYKEAVPIPPYCMIIAVGDFARIEAPTEVTPLTYYVPQTERLFAMQGFAAANPSLKFFSQTIAPYPYEKLALIVGSTRFGGMENSSAIVFPNTLLDSLAAPPVNPIYKIRQGLVEVVAHEISHQWFGDSVTESTWSDLWLSEGFADYFAGLFLQRVEGEAAFQRYMKKEADQYFSFAKRTRTPIHDTETEDLFKLLNANNYQKGAWVLHMLRGELGDETFFRGIRRYYDRHRNSTATTEDLRAAFEEVSGKNLKDFFASWIYGAGHPEYEVSWKWNKKSKKAKLVLRQLQNEPAFPNTVPIEIVTSASMRRITVKTSSKQTTEELRLDEAPTSVRVDPEDTILKEIRTAPKS